MAAKISVIHFGVPVILAKNMNHTHLTERDGYDIRLDRVDNLPCVIIEKDGDEWCVFATNVRTFKRHRPPAK
jgi:hypothetical protein